MTDNAEKLISDFKINGWRTQHLYERFFELTNDPEAIYLFCKFFLHEFEKTATLFNDALSYITKKQFAALVTESLAILKQHQNENAEAVIEYASLQFPDLLHEHLELIFELNPNENAYYADYPWRNLPPEKNGVFKNKLKDPQTSLSDKQRLFSCLLETRDVETIQFAFQLALNENLFDRKDLEAHLIYYLEDVGFTIRNGNIQSYCPNTTYHFCFPRDYFSDDRPIHINREYHPTWKLEPSIKNTFEFGGLIQADDNNPFIHIITFSRIPQNIKISGLQQLTLGIHIRELNEYGAVFYKHDELGIPHKIGETKEIEISFDQPIKETNVSLSETPERWKFQSWGSSNSRENLFRLGGEPTWIQSAEVLTCPVCNEKMDFLMQLDTDLPDIDDGEVYFGSGGICYVFWCDKSKVSGYLMQCT